MLSWIAPYKKLILLALVVALFWAARRRYDTHFQNEPTKIWLESAWLKLVVPVQKTIGKLHAGLSFAWEGKEIHSLRQEVEELRRRVQQLREAEQENKRLLALWSVVYRSRKVIYLPARVIAYSPSPFFRSLRINIGKEEGVERGMGVVAAEGLVGRVLVSDAHFADVILVSDPESSTDVLVGNKRLRGRLRGRGDGQPHGCRVDYLTRSTTVEIGDAVVTTGANEIFPKGVLVGYVSDVYKTPRGLYQEVMVEPAHALQNLEEVLVIRQKEEQAEVLPALWSYPFLDPRNPFYSFYQREQEWYPSLF